MLSNFNKLYIGYIMLILLPFVLLLTLSSILSQCNNNEIRPGKHIGVCISVANNRLFVGSIPKSKTKEQIVEEFAKVTGESASYFYFKYVLFHVIHIQHLHYYIVMLFTLLFLFNNFDKNCLCV